MKFHYERLFFEIQNQKNNRNERLKSLCQQVNKPD